VFIEANDRDDGDN